MSALPAIIAAQAASAEASANGKALAPFKAAQAFGPGEAIDWRPTDKTGEALVRAGVLKELRPGRYWYDRQAERSQHQGLGKVMLVLVGLVLLAGLVLSVTV